MNKKLSSTFLQVSRKLLDITELPDSWVKEIASFDTEKQVFYRLEDFIQNEKEFLDYLVKKLGCYHFNIYLRGISHEKHILTNITYLMGGEIKPPNISNVLVTKVTSNNIRQYRKLDEPEHKKRLREILNIYKKSSHQKYTGERLASIFDPKSTVPRTKKEKDNGWILVSECELIIRKFEWKLRLIMQQNGVKPGSPVPENIVSESLERLCQSGLPGIKPEDDMKVIRKWLRFVQEGPEGECKDWYRLNNDDEELDWFIRAARKNKLGNIAKLDWIDLANLISENTNPNETISEFENRIRINLVIEEVLRSRSLFIVPVTSFAKSARSQKISPHLGFLIGVFISSQKCHEWAIEIKLLFRLLGQPYVHWQSESIRREAYRKVTSSISHKMGSELSVLKGAPWYIKRVLDEGKLKPSQENYLRILQFKLEHTHNYLSSLKRRWEHGTPHRYKYVKFDAIKELHDLELLKEGMCFHFNHSMDSLYIEAEFIDFWSIFNELTHNSRKHNKQNAKIEVTISIDSDDTYIVIIYSDNNQVRPSNERICFNEGLTTIEGIINRHGGSFQCKLTPGESAEFTIRLPIKQTPKIRKDLQ